MVFKKGFDKMSNNIKVITQKKELYDECENMEELYDKYYLPLLEKHYKKTYILEQALGEIEKYLKNDIESCNSALSNPEYTIINKHELLKNEKQKDIDILKIIQKAKGDVKNEN